MFSKIQNLFATVAQKNLRDHSALMHKLSTVFEKRPRFNEKIKLFVL